MISGYAEILKYSLIRDKKFFLWLLKNGNSILNLDEKVVYTQFPKAALLRLKLYHKMKMKKE